MSISAPTLPPPVAADPTLDFVGIFADQTEDVILARMQDWANEGLDPVADADLWVDTREGGHWQTCVMPVVRELARLYDVAGTEVPMTAFVLWAWGTYLDDLAAAAAVDRKAATPAIGSLTFTNASAVPVDIALQTTATTAEVGTDVTPEFATTQAGTVPAGGGLDLSIEATEGGEAGNVAAGAITVPSTPLPAGVTIVNNAPTTGGTDPETDDALRSRVLQAVVATGGANVPAYARWAMAWPGVGAVKVVPAWNGPNSVLVLVTDQNGEPLPSGVVSGLQASLDPVAGQGSGEAPVGAQVTVATSVAHNITVDATVTWKQGYSATGAGGTVAVGQDIASATQDYMISIPPGGTVRLAHVAGIIATWEGVENVSNVLLNGAAADVTLATTPTPESAQLIEPIAFH